jgi:5'-nucleotidase
VAAAKQAALLGLRGIALSVPAGLDSAADFESLKSWVRQVLQTLLPERDLPLVNVNFPRHPRGLIWTRASVRRYDGKIVPTQDPAGRGLFWFTVTPIEGAEEGTDRWAIEQGWVSLTPLRLDLTDGHALEEARARRPLDEVLAAAVSPGKSSAQAAEAVREEEAPAAIPKALGEPTGS